ncbi:MAG: enolase [Thermoplasmata archaeon]|nr:enolase [Thermoplasmata archaeon]
MSLRLIYDSRGAATVEATVVAESGARSSVGAPSGASTGTHEVRAWPEGGVPTALEAFRRWGTPTLVGLPVDDQARVDAALHAADGSRDFSQIGGNTATALSVATAEAAARERGIPLWELLQRPGVPGTAFPAIVGNCLNGGRHAIGGPDIQEFHAVARGPPADAIRGALAVHAEVGRRLKAQFPKLALGRGDEGGWVAPIDNVEAVELLAASCTAVRDQLKVDVTPGLDLAATEFYRDGRYRYHGHTVDTEGQLDFVTKLVERFGLTYVEDPFEEEAFDAFHRLTEAVGRKALIVGDDLYTTSLPRVLEGDRRHSTNAVLIKVNQVGTLTDALATVDFARAHGMVPVVSHRSGDVPDGWLAHLALATAASGLKCGLLGGERVAKLNELLRLGAPPETP